MSGRGGARDPDAHLEALAVPDAHRLQGLGAGGGLAGGGLADGAPLVGGGLAEGAGAALGAPGGLAELSGLLAGGASRHLWVQAADAFLHSSTHATT